MNSNAVVRISVPTTTFDMERAMGIEPTLLAWEARALPLCDARRFLSQNLRHSIIN